MVERGVVKQEQGDLFLPPGFRFHPTDEEVVTSYLLRKFLNPSFDPRAIAEVNLNKCEPRDLPSKAKMGEKEWYFFCHKDMKYPTGVRTNRATKEGYWKATGKDREIFKPVSDGGGGRRELVGMKKTLVFYTGRAPRGSKTNWVMHEFRLEGKYRDTANLVHLTPKDEWVVCKVFHKSNGEDNKKADAAANAAAAAGAGDGGDDVLVDSKIDPVCFEYSTSSLLDTTTTTTTTMDVTTMAPYDAAAMLTNVVGSFVDDLPNYTLISDTTNSSRRNLHQHQTTTVAGSTAVPASSGYSSPWTTSTLRPDYSYLAMGSYDLLDQAMTAKALGLGGVVSPAVAGGLPSYPVAGTSQQSSLGHY